MFCTNCGFEIGNPKKFCTNCGFELALSEVSQKKSSNNIDKRDIFFYKSFKNINKNYSIYIYRCYCLDYINNITILRIHDVLYSLIYKFFHPNSIF